MRCRSPTSKVGEAITLERSNPEDSGSDLTRKSVDGDRKSERQSSIIDFSNPLESNYKTSNDQRQDAARHRFAARNTFEKVHSNDMFDKVVFTVMTSINYNYKGPKEYRDIKGVQKERNRDKDIDAIKSINLHHFGQSRTMEDAIKLIEDFKLQVKFQMNTDNSKIPHFYDGYSTHKIRLTDLHSASLSYSKKPKNPSIFGKTFEKIARDNLNFFHYKFCQWSPAAGSFVTGNKLLFNKDQTQWQDLDSFIAESAYPLKRKPEHLRHEMFCLTVVVSSHTDREVFAKMLETLDARLPEAKLQFSTAAKSPFARDCTVVVGSNFNTTSQFKKSDNIFLEYPVVSVLPEGSAFVFELSWLLSNSFFVFTVLSRVRTALEKHNFEYHLLDKSLKHFWRHARLGVVVRYKISDTKSPETIISELLKLGFAKLSELMNKPQKRAAAMMHLQSGLLLEISPDWKSAFLLETDIFYSLASRVKTDWIDDALRQVLN